MALLLAAGSAQAETLRIHAAGFDPLALPPAPAPAPPPGLLVQRAGQASRFLPEADIQSLTPFTQHVGFGSAHGVVAHDWTGPRLWEVLVRAGLIDPQSPARPAADAPSST